MKTAETISDISHKVGMGEPLNASESAILTEYLHNVPEKDTEHDLICKVHEMCVESLETETLQKWREVMDELYYIRTSLIRKNPPV